MEFGEPLWIVVVICLGWIFIKAKDKLFDTFWPKTGRIGINPNAFSYMCVHCTSGQPLQITSVTRLISSGFRCAKCNNKYVAICPQCGAAEHEKPTISQKFWGGFTCRNCGSIWDRYATKKNQNI